MAMSITMMRITRQFLQLGEFSASTNNFGCILCRLNFYTPTRRGGMIQTHEQYAFIHQALCEYEKELAAEPSDSSYPAD